MIYDPVDTKCLNCNKKLQRLGCSGMDVPAPRENDVTVCSNCLCICRFDKNGNISPFSKEELAIFEKNEPGMYFVLDNLKSFIKKKVIHTLQ